jgi:hypothetical protein
MTPTASMLVQRIDTAIVIAEIISVATHRSACTCDKSLWVGNDVLHRLLSADSGLDFGILSLCSRPCVSPPTPGDLVSYDHRLA